MAYAPKPLEKDGAPNLDSPYAPQPVAIAISAADVTGLNGAILSYLTSIEGYGPNKQLVTDGTSAIKWEDQPTP